MTLNYVLGEMPENWPQERKQRLMMASLDAPFPLNHCIRYDARIALIADLIMEHEHPLGTIDRK